MARLLLVNDERDLLVLSQDVLQEEGGHEVEIAAGGAAGLALARRLRPDLIVLDWIMPDMDAAAVVAGLRSAPETEGIPILVMSALIDGSARARLVGAAGFLPKPFTGEELVRAVSETLAAHAAAAERS